MLVEKSTGTDETKVPVLRLLFQQVSVVGVLHGFLAVAQVELVQDIVDVILDRLVANGEPLGNFPVRQPRGYLANNVQFARR